MTHSPFRKSEGLLRLLGNFFFKCFVTLMLVEVCIIVYEIEVNLIHALKLLISFPRWRVSTNENLLGELCPEYKPAS